MMNSRKMATGHVTKGTNGMLNIQQKLQASVQNVQVRNHLRTILHNFFQGLALILEGMVRLYIFWVLVYTVLEYFAPGLPSQILANFGKVWQALSEMAMASNGILDVVAKILITVVEKFWEFFATKLPFLV